jgi:invasion protein IalB
VKFLEHGFMVKKLALPVAALMVLAATPAAHNARAATPAQTTDQAAAPADATAVAGTPDLTTATFGDWVVRCGLTEAAQGQPGRKNCEVVQNIMVQGQSAPFAQIAFGKLTQDAPLFFTAVVPVSISLPSTIRISAEKSDAQPVEVAYTRCLPTGCFASLQMTDGVLEKWRALSAMGEMTFKTGNGQDATVPISFKGLARALDDFAKQ